MITWNVEFVVQNAGVYSTTIQAPTYEDAWAITYEKWPNAIDPIITRRDAS